MWMSHFFSHNTKKNASQFALNMATRPRKRQRESEDDDKKIVVIRWEWCLPGMRREDYYTVREYDKGAVCVFEKYRMAPISKCSITDMCGIELVDDGVHMTAFLETHKVPPRPCGKSSECECHTRHQLDIPTTWVTKEPWKRYDTTCDLLDAVPGFAFDGVWTVVLVTDCETRATRGAWKTVKAPCASRKKSCGFADTKCRHCERFFCEACQAEGSNVDNEYFNCEKCIYELNSIGDIDMCYHCAAWVYACDDIDRPVCANCVDIVSD